MEHLAQSCRTGRHAAAKAAAARTLRAAVERLGPCGRAIVPAVFAAALAGGAAAPGMARSTEAPGYEPLETSAYSRVQPFLGKVAAVPPPDSVSGAGETCTAVAVAPRWVLTAAHCVHVRNPAHPPWTARHFDGMYPLGSLIFRLAPIGFGPLYRVVDYAKSDGFPDPSPATEDWIFLKLDRALPIDAGAAPVVAPSRAHARAQRLRIAGFVATYHADGRMDVGASNTPRISGKSCALSAFDSHLHGPMPGLAETDCVPTVNPGLSGAPMFDLDVAAPDARIEIRALKMGAGRRAGSREMVPVLVLSERFFDTYARIVREAGTAAPAGAHPGR